MIGHRCKDCTWFDKEHESVKAIKKIVGKSDIGYCRKHKPVVFLSEGHYWGGWPLVDTLDLCGEFRKEE